MPSKRSKTKRAEDKSKSLMHTDIKDLEVSRKLRALGEVRVTDWEFNDVLPAVRELASREVDIEGFIRHAANYRVFEWGAPNSPQKSIPEHGATASPAEIESSILRAKGFVQYLILQLCENPELAEIRLREYQPAKACLLLIMPHREASAMIGHGGHTAAAIRGLIQDLANRAGHSLDLKIITREESTEKNEVSKRSEPAYQEEPPVGKKREKVQKRKHPRKDRGKKRAVWDEDD